MVKLRYTIKGGGGGGILGMMSTLIVISVQLPFRLHLQDKVTLLIEFVLTLEIKMPFLEIKSQSIFDMFMQN